MKRAIAGSIILFSLVFIGGAANADVVVQMRGAVAFSGISMPTDSPGGLDSMLTCTKYYKGHSVRIESGQYSYIWNGQSRMAMFVNKATRQYALTDVHDLSQSAAVRKAMKTTGVQVDYSEKLLSDSPIRYMGHNCRLYVYTQSFGFPSLNVSINCRVQQTYAVDFPGIYELDSMIAGRRIGGVLLRAIFTMSSPYFGMAMHTQAESISSTSLTEESFKLGKGYTQAVSIEAASGGTAPQPTVNVTGLMGSTVSNPIDSMPEEQAIPKVQAYLQSGNYDQAVAIVKSLEKRGLTAKLGSIANQLGDLTMSQSKTDIAWGWYSLALQDSTIPADLAHAHLALAQYYILTKNNEKARMEANAVTTLDGVSDDDKAKAAGVIKQLDAEQPSP